MFDQISVGRWAPTPGAPSTLGEVYSSSREAQAKVDNANAYQSLMEDAYDRRNAAIEAAGGPKLTNPWRAIPDAEDQQRIRLLGEKSTVYVPQYMADKYDRDLQDIQSTNPHLAHVIQAERPPSAEVREAMAAAEQRRADILQRRGMLEGKDIPVLGSVPLVGSVLAGAANLAYQPSASAMMMAGSVRSQLTSPADLMAMAIGPFGTRETKSLVWNATRNAINNALGQAAIEPIVQANRAAAGLESGISLALEDVAGAAGIGAALDVGIRAPVRYARRYMGAEGLGGAFTSVPPSLPEPPKPAPKVDPDLVQKASSGDVGAMRQLAEQTRAIDEPGIRTMLDHVEMTGNVDEALKKFKDEMRTLAGVEIDDGDLNRTIAAEMRAAIDPDALPVKREPAAVRPAAEPLMEADVARLMETRAGELDRLMTRASETLDLRIAQMVDEAFQAGMPRIVAAVKDAVEQLADGRSEAKITKAFAKQVRAIVDETGFDKMSDMLALHSGRSSVLEVATAMRRSPDLVDSNVSFQTEMMQVARSLSALDDGAWSMVARGEADPRIAQLVSDHVDAGRQAGVLDQVMRSGIRDLDEARKMIADLEPVQTPEPIRNGVDDPNGAETKAATERLEKSMAPEVEAARKAIPDPQPGQSVVEAILQSAVVRRGAEVQEAIIDAISLAQRILPEGTKLRVETAEMRDPVTGALLDAQSTTTTGDIAVASYALNPAGRIGHEGVHTLVTKGLISPDEVKLLAEAAAKTEIKAEGPAPKEGEQPAPEMVFSEERRKLYAEAYKDRPNLDQLLDEEAAAHLIEAVINKKAKPEDAPRTIVERIQKMLEAIAERLKNWRDGKGWQTAEDLINDILNGEVAKREAVKAWMRSEDLKAVAVRPGVMHAIGHEPGLTDRVRSLFHRITGAANPVKTAEVIDLIRQIGTEQKSQRDKRAFYEAATRIVNSFPDEAADGTDVPGTRLINDLEALSRYERAVLDRELRRNFTVIDGPMFALSDASTGQSMRRDLDALGFYSKLDEVLKTLPPNLSTGTGREMLGRLIDAGVKKSEIEARGLDKFLVGESISAFEERIARSFSPEAKARAGEMQALGEELKASPAPDRKAAIIARRKALSEEAKKEAQGKQPVKLLPEAERTVAVGDLVKAAGKVELREVQRGDPIDADRQALRDYLVGDMLIPAQAADRIINQVLTGDFIGSKAYEDLLKKDPNIKRKHLATLIDNVDAKSDFYNGTPESKWSNYSLDPSNPTYRETVIHLPEAAVEHAAGDIPLERLLNHNRAQFQSGHFPEPNIVGHLMTSMTRHEGKPVYTIDQIQSDWGQKIRDEGVRNQDRVATLTRQLEEAEREIPDAKLVKYFKVAQKALVKAHEYAVHDKNWRGAIIKDRTPSSIPAMEIRNATMGWFSSPEQIAARISGLPAIEHFPELVAALNSFRAAQSELSERRRLVAELRTAEAATPGHPLVNTTDQWTTTTLRRAIRQAAEADAEYIAIPSGDTVLSYNPGDTHGMREFYNKIVPKNLRNILSKLDKDSPAPQHVAKLETMHGFEGWQGEHKERATGRRLVDDRQMHNESRIDKAQTGFTLFPLTDKVKASVKTQGQAMFAFAGAKAKSADLAALERAKKMEKEGFSRQDIREETGWLKNPGGHWVFEISDRGAKETGRAVGEGDTLAQHLHHPEIFAQYPELADIRVRKAAAGATSIGALYFPRRDGLSGAIARMFGADSGYIGINARTDTSSMLHEMQHAIDDIEGNLRGIKSDPYGTTGYTNAPFEKTARAVQARADLTDAERAARPPWFDWEGAGKFRQPTTPAPITDAGGPSEPLPPANDKNKLTIGLGHNSIPGEGLRLTKEDIEAMTDAAYWRLHEVAADWPHWADEAISGGYQTRADFRKLIKELNKAEVTPEQRAAAIDMFLKEQEKMRSEQPLPPSRAVVSMARKAYEQWEKQGRPYDRIENNPDRIIAEMFSRPGLRGMSDAKKTAWVIERLQKDDAEFGRKTDVYRRALAKLAAPNAGQVMFAFAGEKAKTADLTALSKAKEMESSGTDRTKIWTETGWFRGVDGKWRFEINDRLATISNDVQIGEQYKLPEVLKHGRLYQAYPSLTDVLAYPLEGYEGWSTDEAVGIGMGRERKQTALHEAQHMVQTGEGMAAGGSPTSKQAWLQPNYRQKYDAEIQRLVEVYRQDYPDLTDKQIRSAVHQQAVQNLQFKWYWNLAGEVEARTVEKRMNMTPEERKARPPWEDYDVPEDQQIVRSAGGTSASKEPQSPFVSEIQTADRLKDAADAITPKDNGGAMYALRDPKDIIDELERKSTIGKTEAEDIRKALDALKTAGHTDDEALHIIASELEASGESKKRTSLLAEIKWQRLLKDLLTYRNHKGEVDILEAWKRIHERYDTTGTYVQDLETARLAIIERSLSKMDGLLKVAKRGAITGDMRRQFGSTYASLQNIAREAFGESTGDAKAKQFAEAWQAVAEELRQRFNAAGGHIAKLEKWGLPQGHDPQALRDYGLSRWVDYMMQDGLLDRDRMVSPLTGRKLTDGELREALGIVWGRITTDGWVDREITGQPMGRGALFNQHADHRFIHFKNADAWMRYAKDFGNPDIYGAMMSHIARMARDIAHMERLGPNPAMMRTYIRNWMTQKAKSSASVESLIIEQRAKIARLAREHQRELKDLMKGREDLLEDLAEAYLDMNRVKLRSGIKRAFGLKEEEAKRLAELDAKTRKIDDLLYGGQKQRTDLTLRHAEIRQQITDMIEAMRQAVELSSDKDPEAALANTLDRVDAMWEAQRGALVPVSTKAANVMAIGRNMISSSSLGAAVLSSLSDPQFGQGQRMRWGEAFGRSNAANIMRQTIANLVNPNSKWDALDSGIAADTFMATFGKVARENKSRLARMRTNSGFVADRVLAIGLLTPWTEAGKAAHGTWLQLYLGRHAHLGWDKLPTEIKSGLSAHGFDQEAWEKIRFAPLFDPNTKSLATHRSTSKQLRPKEIELTAGRELAERYISMIVRDTRMAVPESTVESRSMVLGKTRPGTISGEIVRSFGQFKAFPLAIATLHLGQLARELGAGNYRSPAVYAGTLLITSAFLGAISMALKDIKDGRDPRRWLDEQTYLAFDTWAAAMLQSGGLGIYGDFFFSNVNRHGGGLASTLGGPMVDRIDNIRELTLGNAIQLYQGKDTHFGREAVRFLKSNTPGLGSWFFSSLIYQRVAIDQLQRMVDPKHYEQFRAQVMNRRRDYGGQEYWWRPGQPGPDRAPDFTRVFATH